MNQINKRGRPATGRLSPLESKQSLIKSGGRIMQLRLIAQYNDALIKLTESGEFSTATKAIGTALLEAVNRRAL